MDRSAVVVDVTRLWEGIFVPVSIHENRASEVGLAHLTRQGISGRLKLVLVDRAVTRAAAGNDGLAMQPQDARAGWVGKQPVLRPSRPSRHEWRIGVAHGRLGRSRRFAKSFESSTTTTTTRIWLAPGCLHRDPRAADVGHPERGDRARRRSVEPICEVRRMLNARREQCWTMSA